MSAPDADPVQRDAKTARNWLKRAVETSGQERANYAAIAQVHATLALTAAIAGRTQ